MGDDVILRRKLPALRDSLVGLLDRLKPEQATVENAEAVRSLAEALRGQYIASAHDLLVHLVRDAPGERFDIEDVAAQLMAELRARGLSDGTLLDAGSKLDGAEDPQAALGEFFAALECIKRDYVFFVPADLGPYAKSLPVELAGVTVVDQLPNGTKGTFVRIVDAAIDPRAEARSVRSRAATLIDSAAVFLAERLEVTEGQIVIESGGALLEVSASDDLHPYPREASTAEIKRMMASVWAASRIHGSDPVADAIRHHHRATTTVDDESRFMMLWFGLERIVSGSADHDSVGAATRNLIPKAITLAKLRRELTAFCDRLKSLPPEAFAKARAVAGGMFRDEPIVLREKVLEFLLADDATSKQFTAAFYEEDVVAVQWYARLRRSIRGVNGTSIGANVAKYLEVSRERIEWHIVRLYRARNGVVHAANRPALIHDLTRHAHFFLTNVIAIAVRYRENNPSLQPADLLTRRCGQYDAYLDLLRKEFPQAKTLDALLRPTSVFK